MDPLDVNDLAALRPGTTWAITFATLAQLQPGDVILNWPREGPRGGEPTKVLVGRPKVEE